MLLKGLLWRGWLFTICSLEVRRSSLDGGALRWQGAHVVGQGFSWSSVLVVCFVAIRRVASGDWAVIIR
jgi:hypothetical protein